MNMVYHEIKIKGKKRYNYIVKTLRQENRWKKLRKYIGEGHLKKNEILKAFDDFKSSVEESEYLSETQKELIEQINLRFNEYLIKGGKSGSENFREWFFTELTYNSNAIEGSTAGLRETSMIINDGIIPKTISLREMYEARNHKKALEFLASHKGDVNEKLIKILHFILMEDIDKKRGKYREVPVFILGSGAKLPDYKKVPVLMYDLVSWYKKNKHMHSLELAAIFSMKFVTIHPFTDGNGRVSRLLMNYILKKKKHPEINIYVKDRNNYLRAVRSANDGKYKQIIDFLFMTLKKNYEFLKDV
jgi:Fic family protein